MSRDSGDMWSCLAQGEGVHQTGLSKTVSFLFESVVGAACIPPGGKVVSAACPE